MNCPKCTYPNPQGVTYCQMCYEVFNKSAADRYLHAQKRARMNRKESSPEAPSSEPEKAKSAEEKCSGEDGRGGIAGDSSAPDGKRRCLMLL